MNALNEREMARVLAILGKKRAWLEALVWDLFAQADSRLCSEFEQKLLLKFLWKQAKLTARTARFSYAAKRCTPERAQEAIDALPKVEAVLFDLDGTLADTAPDLAWSLNTLLQEEGREPLAFETMRALASFGSTEFIRAGFNIEPDHPEFEPLRERFLALYSEHYCVETRVFSGMELVLAYLHELGMKWGVVTNKPARFTEPLMAALTEHLPAPSVIVSGDTLSESKPSPKPLLFAAEKMGVLPEHCVYLGDAQRDIVAGNAAGMWTMTALFGYLDLDEAMTWESDAFLSEPLELLAILSILS